MTLTRREAPPGQPEPGGAPAARVPSFRREFREPAGYERALVVKAVLAVVLVAIIVTVRALYLT